MNKSLEYAYVCLPPDKQIPIHSQSTWELSCVITGEGTRLLGDVTEEFESGDTVLIPPGMIHHWYFKNGGTDIENVTILFDSEFLKNVKTCFPELSDMMEHLMSLGNAVIFSGETRRKIYFIMLRMRTESTERRIFSLAEILMLIAEDKTGRMIASSKNLSKAEIRYSQIRSYVNCNYYREITLDEISRFSGMNKTAFCAFFKAQTSKTFVEYLNQIRLDAAVELLKSTEQTVSEIASQVGVTDTAYFCRLFKKNFGFTPSEFRKALNASEAGISRATN